MADMTPFFRKRLDTLQQARANLESELEVLSKAVVVGQPALQRLAATSSHFFRQADSLLDTMLDRDADADMVAPAEELVEYFEDTARRLQRLVPKGQGEAEEGG